MSTEEFIIGLFVRVDDAMLEVPLHPQGLLYPSEIVTLGLLYALKGGGQRAFYRWLTRDYRGLFPLGAKGLSNHRWIVGAKLAVVLNKWGLVCGWDADAASVHDSAFHGLIRRFDGRMIVLTDHNFVATSGNPPNMKPVKKGTWNDRMLIETFYSLLTGVCHAKKMTHRTWAYVCMRLAFLLALFNILVQWEGLPLDAQGCAHRSLAPFSL